MPSPEGSGTARRAWQTAWEQYSNAVKRMARPVLEPAAKPIGRGMTFDLLGFWLVWHLEGGFEGLQDPKKLGMSRSAVYRRVTLFRRLTGQHPDDFRLAGVSLSVEEYVAAVLARDAAKQTDPSN